MIEIQSLKFVAIYILNYDKIKNKLELYYFF